VFRFGIGALRYQCALTRNQHSGKGHSGSQGAQTNQKWNRNHKEA
jgi:hypothetical protein